MALLASTLPPSSKAPALSRREGRLPPGTPAAEAQGAQLLETRLHVPRQGVHLDRVSILPCARSPGGPSLFTRLSQAGRLRQAAPSPWGQCLLALALLGVQPQGNTSTPQTGCFLMEPLLLLLLLPSSDPRAFPWGKQSTATRGPAALLAWSLPPEGSAVPCRELTSSWLGLASPRSPGAAGWGRCFLLL